MSNSSLISYTCLSPNNSGQRTHSIDRITPHCVVGQLSAEGICGCFTSPSVQASCNYGIGTDGRIGLCVEEKNRSWCSSSNANDQRAVTIECASDMTSPYAMNSKVYASLINLCADICQRNGKKKLIWFGDKNKALNYEPASDEMVITVHRWFANKSCPGDWLYSRMNDLATQVTNKLSGNTTTSSSVSTTNQLDKTNTTLVGLNNEEKIWNYLYSKLNNAYGCAGCMGNLFAESALNPKNLQDSFEKKLGYTDETYTSAVDNNAYTNFVKDKAGYGLCQWTYWSRKQNLLNYCKSKGTSIGNLEMQLEFLFKELSDGYGSVLSVLKSATSVLQASNAMLLQYERPADQSIAVQNKRASYSQKYYDKYANKTISVGNLDNSDSKTSATTATKNTRFPTVPFTVQVISPKLKYRSIGSSKGEVLGLVGKGSYTIEEVNSKGWGKLKSGAGWIYLKNPSYCTIGQTVLGDSNNVTKQNTPNEYLVRVTAGNLNIRSGAGISYSVCDSIKDKGVYTIIAEADGDGATKWGKLKSGLGWISLDYCTKI